MRLPQQLELSLVLPYTCILSARASLLRNPFQFAIPIASIGIHSDRAPDRDLLGGRPFRGRSVATLYQSQPITILALTDYKPLRYVRSMVGSTDDGDKIIEAASAIKRIERCRLHGLKRVAACTDS